MGPRLGDLETWPGGLEAWPYLGFDASGLPSFEFEAPRPRSSEALRRPFRNILTIVSNKSRKSKAGIDSYGTASFSSTPYS